MYKCLCPIKRSLWGEVKTVKLKTLTIDEIFNIYKDLELNEFIYIELEAKQTIIDLLKNNNRQYVKGISLIYPLKTAEKVRKMKTIEEVATVSAKDIDMIIVLKINNKLKNNVIKFKHLNQNTSQKN